MKPTCIKSFFKCLFLAILLNPGIAYGTSSGISADTTKIPEALRITRDGKSPETPLKTEYLLADLGIDTVRQVFQAPPCLEGDYYLAFQLFYDLGDRQTQQDWLADLEITLRYNTDSLWTKPLSLAMENQIFIATVFNDSLVTCGDHYTFKIHNKQLQNGAPEAYIYLNVLLYKHEEALFNPAGPLTLDYSYVNEEIKTSWSYTGPGLESFDLEWVFIDSLDIFFVGTTAQEAFDWKEPVRISTTAQQYSHISYYPNGRLWYRVRAVGINPAYPGHRIAGHWHYGTGVPISIDNHQKGITWQQQTVFSENGKYKKVMNYYDGTSRQRQVLTNLSSQDVTLVGENLYDYEGRAVGTVLPVPGAGHSLQYKANFNTFQPLDADVTAHVSPNLKKFNYDNHREVNSIIATTTGAGKYYSSNNDLQQLYKDFLPDADGYVYTQTEYLRDGTERISRQSGVGETFKMDGAHVVRYYYGEAAPYDLVRLFGSNVGNANHYKKNMVVDANGQVSISYLDQEDRTIATALAGTPPANLDTLPGFKALDPADITVDISQKNSKANGISQLQHKILNTSPNTQYSFEYELMALGAELDTLGCQDCTFDVKISITDPDGIALDLSGVTGNESSDPHLYELFNRTGTDCINPINVADVQFSVMLADVGDYTLTKTVTPRDLSFSQMRTLVAENDSIAQLVQQISASYEVDPTDCEICEATCPEAEAAINEAIDEIAEKDCENIYLQIEQFFRDRDGAASVEPYEVPLDSIESHPDYCAYLLCAQNQASDVFEKQIARIADWDAAVTGGYDQLLTLDPFFTNQDLSGYDHQAAMQSRLDNMHIADVPYDSNNDGVQDGVTTYAGTIDQVTDPANTSFYINERGLNDVNGFHILYQDLMRRQSEMTVQEYNEQLSFQRWVLFRNFYLEAKRKTKLEIPAFQNCPKAMEELGAQDELPQTEQDVTQWAKANGLTGPVSNETVEMMVANISGSCNTSFSYADSVAIANYLQAYFDSNSNNFFKLILKPDLGNDSNLIGIQNILNGYNCGLDSVALDDPVVCVSDTIMYLPPISDPNPAAGRSLSSFSDNIGNDLTNEQPNRARKKDESHARFDESNFEYQQFLRQDSLGEAETIDDILQRLAARKKKKSAIQSELGNRTLSTAATPTPQRDALIAIYNATGGASWVNNSNWLTANPVYTWYGVNTDVNGNVIELDFERNNLSGSLPAELGDLIYLEYLNLNINQLTGSIPNEIGNLSSLAYLYLTNNPLSGTVPTTIGNLTNLRELWISRTQVSGPIPNEIGNLSNLEFLYLFDNPLSGAIPITIGNLNNLRGLWILRTQVSGPIPSEIGNLSSLENLYLIDNLLTGTIPTTIGNLTSLIDLRIERTQVSGPIPNEIGNLSNLERLSLDFNVNLGDTIPSSIGNLSMLKYMYIRFNSLDGEIPAEIGNLINLTQLYLNNNSLTGSLPPEIGKLSNLFGLGISDNNLTGSIPPEIGQLNQLRTLSLGNNDLTGQIPIELDSLLNLRTLNLWNNNLTGSISPGIGLLPNLTRLYLSWNNLSGTIPSSLGKPQMELLFLNSNKLSGDIPDELIVLKNMVLDFLINDNAFTFQNFLNIIQGFDGTSQVVYTDQDLIDTVKTVSTSSGESLTLSSNIDRNTNPPSKYQWFKYVDGGADIALNTLSEDGHTLTINNIFKPDEGTQYYYQITNPDAPDLILTSRMQTLVVEGGNEVNLCYQFDTTNITLQQFMFKVDLDQLIQECLDKAAQEDSILINYATEKFYEKAISNFYTSYRINCLEGVNDSLRYTYRSQEYHYTLYYYDQSGNLVQTVPPEGVKPLSTVATTAFLGGTLSQPSHELVTRYQYNSLNQLIEQKTPDAGQSQFWYDEKARLRLSQNAQQLIYTAYSYTKYDEQGRIVEVGEMHTETPLSQLLDSLDSKIFPLATHFTLTDVTRTHYDFPKPGLTAFDQQNLRTRVSWVEIVNHEATDTVITCYSYDIHGNVKSLLQQLPGLAPKRTDYVYDLISGNVNNVLYQYGEGDQFIHRYEYDADNRLTEVYTSTDGFIWDKEAAYTYYLHGPLARVELGEYRVQGMDYYYTLQGWLKGVNQAYEDDPDIINVADYMAGKDVFAFNLGYFNGDYTPANALLTPTEVRDQLWQRYTEMNSDNGLYNGNIAFMTTDLAKVGQENNDRTKGMQAMLYRYDQLNRIIQARSLTNYQAGTGFQTRSSTPAAYDTDYSYDANGNLLTLQRYDESGILQDDFTYSYYEGTNRLMQYLPMNMENKVYNGAVTSNDILYHHITVTGNSYIPTGQDVVLRATGSITISPTFTTSGGNSFKAKLEPDSLAMYQYDAIGNLIRDQYEGVNISWTPYGKVRQVRSRSDSLVVSFTYDAAGNRIAKQVVTQGAELTTVVTRYLRDASGNVLAIYEDSVMIEQPIYGSSRLGMYKGGKLSAHRNMGTKRYELTNHLGNVMTVITDNIGMEQDSVWASVVSTSDYYPFGLGMAGRSFSDSTYRYGFNAKEKDQSGEFGNTTYDYGFRIYNPAIGKFLSVDPLTKEYPMLTPYQFASNTPIYAIDLDGLEALSAQIELRGLISGEVAGVTTSQTVGLLVGRSSNADGIHVAGFYTPTLGIGAGQGLVAGVSTSFYPTATIEDLGGFGGTAGYFLTANPAGVGPVFSGEINATDPTQSNFKVGGTLGINPFSIGVGGGAYAELAYTFLSDIVNIEDLPNSSLVDDLSNDLGVSKEIVLNAAKSLIEELQNQLENFANQQMDELNDIDLLKESIIPSDNSRVVIQKPLIEETEE